MKRLVLLLLILPLVGCLPKAMQNAHEKEGVALYAYQAKSDELYEALLADLELEAENHLATNEAWMIERAVLAEFVSTLGLNQQDESNAELLRRLIAGGSITTAELERIRELRKAAEQGTAAKLEELLARWKKNYELNFTAAMKLHSAIAEWLALTGLF